MATAGSVAMSPFKVSLKSRRLCGSTVLMTSISVACGDWRGVGWSGMIGTAGTTGTGLVGLGLRGGGDTGSVKTGFWGGVKTGMACGSGGIGGVGTGREYGLLQYAATDEASEYPGWGRFERCTVPPVTLQRAKSTAGNMHFRLRAISRALWSGRSRCPRAAFTRPSAAAAPSVSVASSWNSTTGPRTSTCVAWCGCLKAPATSCFSGSASSTGTSAAKARTPFTTEGFVRGVRSYAPSCPQRWWYRPPQSHCTSTQPSPSLVTTEPCFPGPPSWLRHFQSDGLRTTRVPGGRGPRWMCGDCGERTDGERSPRDKLPRLGVLLCGGEGTSFLRNTLAPSARVATFPLSGCHAHRGSILPTPSRAAGCPPLVPSQPQQSEATAEQLSVDHVTSHGLWCRGWGRENTVVPRHPIR
eukprot:Sspe_Gene.68824::Locus_40575_Transcript_1_1_Confidence_1.000_Length_3849::g.68824::m.68824